MATSAGEDTQPRATDVPAVEAAHQLGLGYYALRDSILRHELDGYKNGNRWFVRADSLRRRLRKEAVSA